MTDITSEQIRKRREMLPEILKNALFSADNADKIWQIGKNFNINDADKIAVIGKLTGWVIMGFIKIEDYAKTIQENLNLDFNTASLIAKELESKIFSPIKTELSKLTIYRLNSLNEELRYRVASTTIKSPRSVTIPPQINRVEITPAPASIPPQKPAVPPPPISQSAIPQPTTANQPKTAPVMLYQKQEPKPLAASIKTQIRGEMTADTKSESKQVAARVEIGPEAETLTGGEKKEPVVAKTPQPEFTRMVHYSDFKTPVDNQGQTAIPTVPTLTATQKTAEKTNEEVVDLNTFKPPTGSQPKVEGNTLNLR